MSVWLSLALSSELCKVCRAVTVIILTQYDASRNLSSVNHFSSFFFAIWAASTSSLECIHCCHLGSKSLEVVLQGMGHVFFAQFQFLQGATISSKFVKSQDPHLLGWPCCLTRVPPWAFVILDACVKNMWGWWWTVTKVIRIVSQVRLLSPKSLEPTSMPFV